MTKLLSGPRDLPRFPYATLGAGVKLEVLGRVLHDAALAAALVDRLLHHGEVYYLKGDSYRPRGKPRAPESSNEPESASPGNRVVATPSLNVAPRYFGEAGGA
jgi:hypothetical protein